MPNEEPRARKVAVPASTGTAARLVYKNPARTVLFVTNEGTVDVRLGASDVSSTDGFLLRAAASLAWDDFKGDLFAISTGAGVNVSILEGDDK